MTPRASSNARTGRSLSLRAPVPSRRHRQNRPSSFLTKKSDYDAKSPPYSAYDFNISKLPLNIRCSEEILVKLSQTNMISFL